MTLVCFALPFESAEFEKRVRSSDSVRIIHTGMGSNAAEASLRAAVLRYNPTRIILSGFAGALNPEWKAGDLMIALNLSSSAWVDQIVQSRRADGMRIGDLFTASEVVPSPSEKADLRKRTGADAVDMESAALHKVAIEAGLPVLAIRSISDDAGSDLVVPSDILLAAAGAGAVGTARLILWVICRPSKWMPFYRFVRDSKNAQSALTRVADLL